MAMLAAAVIGGL